MNAESIAKDEEEPQPTQAAASGPLDPIAALTAERDQLAVEKADLQDRFLRSQAEFQNSRKRNENRQRADSGTLLVLALRPWPMREG